MVGAVPGYDGLSKPARVWALALTAVTSFVCSPAPARGEVDPVARCHQQRTTASQRACLEKTRDPRAVPALHQLAREILLRGQPTPGDLGEIQFITIAAGDIGASTDSTYLQKAALFGKPADRVFALRAISHGLFLLWLREDDVRRARLERAARLICENLAHSPEEEVGAAAAQCLREIEFSGRVVLRTAHRSPGH